MSKRLEDELSHITECYLDVPKEIDELGIRSREHINFLLGVVTALIWKSQP